MQVKVLGYDIDLDLEDDEIVMDVMVLVRVQQSAEPSKEGLVSGFTDHTGAVVALGMVHGAVNQQEHQEVS